MVVLLIPAYKPAEPFLPLLDGLLREGFSAIVVVDDGSGPAYRDIFLAAEGRGALVLRHAVNLGKGRALKTGLNEIVLRYPGATVVTADCDGQHTPEDIAAVAEAGEKHPLALTLGVRAFNGKVPLRSRLGNASMRLGVLLSTGVAVRDTQTGLRALGRDIVPGQIAIPGERYEYEMNALLHCPAHGIPIEQVPIQTVYLNRNKGSHFHPFRDACRVFGRLVSFAAVSLLSAAVDYAGYAALLEIGDLSAQGAYLAARIFSGLFNYTLNRKIVFRDHGHVLWQAVKYALLALGIAILGTGMVRVFVQSLGINRYSAKVVADALLFLVSFAGQRWLVFRGGSRR